MHTTAGNIYGKLTLYRDRLVFERNPAASLFLKLLSVGMVIWGVFCVLEDLFKDISSRIYLTLFVILILEIIILIYLKKTGKQKTYEIKIEDILGVESSKTGSKTRSKTGSKTRSKTGRLIIKTKDGAHDFTIGGLGTPFKSKVWIWDEYIGKIKGRIIATYLIEEINVLKAKI